MLYRTYEYRIKYFYSIKSTSKNIYFDFENVHKEFHYN